MQEQAETIERQEQAVVCLAGEQRGPFGRFRSFRWFRWFRSLRRSGEEIDEAIYDRSISFIGLFLVARIGQKSHHLGKDRGMGYGKSLGDIDACKPPSTIVFRQGSDDILQQRLITEDNGSTVALMVVLHKPLSHVTRLSVDGIGCQQFHFTRLPSLNGVLIGSDDLLGIVPHPLEGFGVAGKISGIIPIESSLFTCLQAQH